jgi:hypothetical protein
MRALAGGAATGIGVTLLACLAGSAGAQTLPQVQVPKVPTPQVQVPSLPQVHVPSPQQPSSPSGGSGGGSGGGGTQLPTPSSGGLPSLPVPNFGGGGGGNGGGGSGGSGSQPSGGSGSASSGGGGGSGSGSGSGGSPSAKQRAASEHRLRNSAKRLSSCLGSISGFERRVLVMRAGLTGRPQSRASTARRLRTSSRRVAIAERSSLRRLRLAARNGHCVAANSVGASVTNAALLAAVTPTAQLAAVKSAAGSANKGDQQGVLSASASAPTSKDGEPILGAPAGSTSPPPGDESGPLLILWGIGALILGMGTIALFKRRRVTHAGPLDTPSSKLPPAPWAKKD